VNVGAYRVSEIAEQLSGDGLCVGFGAFSARIRSGFKTLAPLLQELYRDYSVTPATGIHDFDVQVRPSSPLRPWRRQAWFLVDGRVPFWPLPAAHALPALEWGINWCIATRSHHYLMLHSAVVERRGHAILFPAWPGHGKSTLCTALVHSGWRLLSDEFGLLRPEDGALVPLPRLIPLKNQSIEVIRRYRPEAMIGPSFLGTRKGTVAHVRPPADSVSRAQETARARWLVFPRWMADAQLTLNPVPKGEAFLRVATNAFNYEVMGEAAFSLLTDMVKRCDCYALTYSDLDEAIAAIDRMSSCPDA
jgi:HprK-related kinase A